MLDLSENKLRGELPDSLGLLTRLKRLKISNNLFTGQIPRTFQALKLLEQFQLHRTRMADVEFAQDHMQSMLQCANISVSSDKR